MVKEIMEKKGKIINCGIYYVKAKKLFF